MQMFGRSVRVVGASALLLLLAACQTVAAGTSSTNLPTETAWPGAQNPPYICCWDAQGQFVTFTFDASGGATDLTLRYSAGNGAATRKLELDGSVWAANQVFPATPNWSTWSTVTRTATLAAGTHTLKVWFDSAAGSAQYMNLDNLNVTQSIPQPPGLVVSVGYADSASGLTPWSGSAHTVFIGEPPQCCATHGSNNDLPGYDAGAIEVSNNTASPLTVDAVSADFGGSSYPPHFDLWAGSTSPRLPQTLNPGMSLVMTMTSAFNFDTSDLFGEACHVNTRVVPVVRVTVNGHETDYHDDHQILNSDGADLASCPRDVSEQHSFTPVRAGDQPAAAPINDLPPVVTVAVGSASSPAPGRRGERSARRLEREPAADLVATVAAVRYQREQLCDDCERELTHVPSDGSRRRAHAPVPCRRGKRIRFDRDGVRADRRGQ